MLGEMLRRMAERARNAENQQQEADRLRKLAEQLADNMSPEQKRRWAEFMQRELGDQQPPQPPQDPSQPQPQDQDQRQNQDRNQNGEQPGANDQQQRPPQDQSQPNASDSGAQRPPQPDAQPPQGNSGNQPPRQPNDRDNTGSANNTDNRRRNDGSGRGGSEAGTRDAPDRRDPNAAALERDRTDKVDIRGDESAERIIAQWLSDTPPDPDDPNVRATARAAASERVQQAQKVAERAVNDSAVNRRYHRSIQRYFGRLQEAIDKAARGQPPASAAPQPAPAATQRAGGS